jgi:TetR/AcrR family transcriptional regulator
VHRTQAEPGNLREKQKEETRYRILESAASVFAELGFDAASFASIAERAKVKKGLVQYHFTTKEELWKSAITHTWEQRRAALPIYFSSIKRVETTEDLHGLFKAIMRFSMDHPAWVGIMFRESSQPSERLNWLVDNYIRHDYEQGLLFAQEAQVQGLLPELPVLELMHLISGCLTYVLNVAPLTARALGIDSRSDEYLDRHVNALVSLLAGRTATK